MPKLSESARLSSSAPSLDVTFSIRAARPSSPSSTTAAAISVTANSQRWSAAYRMAVKPAHKDRIVIRFGTKT